MHFTNACRFPPGVDPVKCPNYPYCGTPAEVLIIPGVSDGVVPEVKPIDTPGAIPPGPTAVYRDFKDLSRIISTPELFSRYYVVRHV